MAIRITTTITAPTITTGVNISIPSINITITMISPVEINGAVTINVPSIDIITTINAPTVTGV